MLCLSPDSSGPAGEFTVEPKIDSPDIEGWLVEQSEFDALTANENNLETKADSSRKPIDVIPVDTDRMVDGEPMAVCQAGVELEASTTTPDICGVDAFCRDNAENGRCQGVDVTGKKSGTCEVEVSMVDASAVSGSFEVQIE